MSQEIIKDLEKLLEMKYIPSMHIMEEVEKLIKKFKDKIPPPCSEEETPVTLNGSVVSLESNIEAKKKQPKTKTYIPKASFKTITEEEGVK